VVYNWEKKDKVGVDLKGIIRSGSKFKIVNAQNYFGDAIFAGVYDGKPVPLPMKGLSVARPIGDAPCEPPSTEPVFNVFVLITDL